jgi:hypothetical protein
LQTFLKHLSQKNKWLIWKGRIVSLFKIGIFYLIPKGRTCISISVSIQTWVSFTLHVLRNLFYHPEIGKNGVFVERNALRNGRCIEKERVLFHTSQKGGICSNPNGICSKHICHGSLLRQGANISISPF